MVVYVAFSGYFIDFILWTGLVYFVLNDDATQVFPLGWPLIPFFFFLNDVTQMGFKPFTNLSSIGPFT